MQIFNLMFDLVVVDDQLVLLKLNVKLKVFLSEMSSCSKQKDIQSTD